MFANATVIDVSLKNGKKSTGGGEGEEGLERMKNFDCSRMHFHLSNDGIEFFSCFHVLYLYWNGLKLINLRGSLLLKFSIKDKTRGLNSNL